MEFQCFCNRIKSTRFVGKERKTITIHCFASDGNVAIIIRQIREVGSNLFNKIRFRDVLSFFLVLTTSVATVCTLWSIRKRMGRSLSFLGMAACAGTFGTATKHRVTIDAYVEPNFSSHRVGTYFSNSISNSILNYIGEKPVSEKTIFRNLISVTLDRFLFTAPVFY